MMRFWVAVLLLSVGCGAGKGRDATEKSTEPPIVMVSDDSVFGLSAMQDGSWVVVDVRVPNRSLLHLSGWLTGSDLPEGLSPISGEDSLFSKRMVARRPTAVSRFSVASLPAIPQEMTICGRIIVNAKIVSKCIVAVVHGQAAVPIERTARLVLSRYAFNEGALPDHGKEPLRALLESFDFQSRVPINIRVIGHADERGSDWANRKKSEERAATICDRHLRPWLKARESRVNPDCAGMGDNVEAFDGASDAENRRVEIEIRYVSSE